MSASVRLFRIVFLALVLLALASPAALAQGIKIFVFIDEIRGESVDPIHREWIDAAACSESIINSVSAAGGGGGVSRLSFSDIKILKSVDMTSPKLREAVATGKHIRNATIEFWQTIGGESKRYLEIKLSDVLITEVSMTVQIPDVSQK